MESIIDVLQIASQGSGGANGETVNEDEGANYSTLDQHNYDSQEDMIMMAANEEYQPVPAPPIADGDEEGGGGGGTNGVTATNGSITEETPIVVDSTSNGVADNTNNATTTDSTTQNGTTDTTTTTTNGRRRTRSSSKRRHGSRSRSRGRRDRSRSRSRSRSRHRRGGNRRSRSPPRRGGRGGDRRRSPPHRSSNIKHDKDQLKYRWDRTIFVSNIPYEVKWAELKDLFREKCGDSSVVYCEVYERASDGKSLGVATIEFRTVADAERAVDVMHSYEMDGRKLSVRMDQEGFKARQARDMAGIPSGNRRDSPDRGRGGGSSNGYGSDSGGLLGMLGLGGGMLGLGGGGGGGANANNTAWLNSLAAQMKIEGPVTKRIFVASLDYKVDEHKLREVYGLAGRVRSVSLFRDRDNKSRGMALIEYDTGFDALNAVAMFNKQTLLDREMNVRFDTKPPTKEEEERSMRSSSSRGGDSGGSRLPSGLRSIGSGLAPLIAAAAATPQVNPLSAALGGLGSIQSLGINTQPVASNALTLGALTALAGLNSGALGGGASQSGNPNQNSQVAAAAAAAAAGLAGSLNSAGLGGLNTNALNSSGLGGGGGGPSSGLGSGANDLVGNGFGLSSGGFSNMNSMSSMNNMNNMSNMGGYSNQMFGGETNGRGMNGSKQDSKRGGGITKIFIKNLPFSWDERRLKEKFSQAGRIEYAEIKKKDGKSRGFGMVRYSYPDQAEKAVELFNGSNFDGRTLEVKLDLM